jgi:Tfp pilus assembly protein FimT
MKIKILAITILMALCSFANITRATVIETDAFIFSNNVTFAKNVNLNGNSVTNGSFVGNGSGLTNLPSSQGSASGAFSNLFWVNKNGVDYRS